MKSVDANLGVLSLTSLIVMVSVVVPAVPLKIVNHFKVIRSRYVTVILFGECSTEPIK